MSDEYIKHRSEDFVIELLRVLPDNINLEQVREIVDLFSAYAGKVADFVIQTYPKKHDDRL